ncbi:MAG: CoA-transferase [Desulfobacterales bacterium]|nr:CoA-transferase [Desulfobacterales bacterium]
MKELFDFREKNYGSSGKVVSLQEAVSRSIAPGKKLHLSTGPYGNAVVREIIRQFWNTDPGFTVISSGIVTPFEVALACGGLVKKALTTNHSYTYPTPKPIPLLQKMEKEGRLDIENWSLYALEQRLMAGAMGVGFMPTKSLMGTSLGEENHEAFTVIPDPFDAGKKIGCVKALVPDVSILHGCVADHEGNVILSPPYFAGLWGARACRDGVIATVEKIVSTDFIRQHSALVKIPAHLVKFVCQVPFGSHPQGLAAESIGIEEGYGEDYDFICQFVAESQDAQQLEKWVRTWILQCPTHEDYLRKVGPGRLLTLRGKSRFDAWRYEAPQIVSGPDVPGDFNGTEMMIVAAAREIRDTVMQKGYQTILTGIGSPGLAAWLAFYLLKQAGNPVTLLTGFGQVGYVPQPGDPFLLSQSNVMTCTMLTDTVEVYGTLVGGAHNRCLSVLGTAQIDQFGNINTVRIDGAQLIGVGGAGDAVNARETLVVAKQSAGRFLEKLQFVSCSGKSVGKLVTDLGVFSKSADGQPFTLIKYFQNPSPDGREEQLVQIRKKCGWPIKTADALEEVLWPTSEELYLLRALDPKGSFTGK